MSVKNFNSQLIKYPHRHTQILPSNGQQHRQFKSMKRKMVQSYKKEDDLMHKLWQALSYAVIVGGLALTVILMSNMRQAFVKRPV